MPGDLNSKTMKYEIKAVRTSSIDVEFEDGATATIDVTKGENKASIQSRIAGFETKEAFDGTSSVPVTVGETGDTDVSPTANEKLFTYGVARAQHYPNLGDQLDALYWNRKGDASHLNTINTAIEDTKTKWPKTLADMTIAEYEAKVKELYG